MKQLLNYLNVTIKKEKSILRFVVVIFLVGLICGSLFITFITSKDRILLVNQVGSFMQNIKVLSKSLFGLEAFKSNLFQNFLQVFIIFILGLSMIGILMVIIILFYKGFMLGTTLSAFVLKYKFKGLIALIMYVIPCQIVSVLTYFFAAFFSVYVSIKFIKAIIKKDNLNFKTFLGKYLCAFVITLILISISSFLDAYLMPFLMRLASFIL